MAEMESDPTPAEAAPAVPGNDRADEVRQPPDGWPGTAGPPSRDTAVPEVRQAPAVSPRNLFDTVWPSDGRGTAEGLEPRIEPLPEPRLRPVETEVRAGAPAPPLTVPPPVAPAPVRLVHPEPRQLPILKSGVIDEMAYTLFTDGSIEAQLPDGTMRFASIEELRRHLEKHEG